MEEGEREKGRRGEIEYAKRRRAKEREKEEREEKKVKTRDADHQNISTHGPIYLVSPRGFFCFVTFCLAPPARREKEKRVVEVERER